MIWAGLFHLSFNFSSKYNREYYAFEAVDDRRPKKGEIEFDEDLWNEILEKMVSAGMTMLVLSVDDGVQYRSHPEIAAKNAWPIGKLKAKLAKARKLGLEVVPQLNFSTRHDAWLGEYSQCVSTDAYYAVCRDLIAEVIDIFEKPRFFHLGMDEEAPEYQRNFQYVVVRQHDLWWHDLYFYIDCVTGDGCRPWVWSDEVWRHPEEFLKKMPKSVIQSNWYYKPNFDQENRGERDLTIINSYCLLEEHGYDQIPTGSNIRACENFGMLVDYCSRHIDRQRLVGFLQCSWKPMLATSRERHIDAIEQVGRVITKFNPPS